MELSKGQTWGRHEVEAMLDDLRSRGEYKTRQEILRTIKAQEVELVQYESQMANTSILIITMLAGYAAKLLTQRLLEKAFAK